MMKISIVTPSFNQDRFIADAIESVSSQAYPFVEHLILDNCSSDDTASIISKYPQVTLIREPDKGQSDALNKGFKRASGEIIGWLNADDRYLPGCFDAVSRFFEENPSCDIVYGDYRLIDQQGRVLCLRKEIGFDMFMLKYLHVLCIPSTTVFFRRRIFDEGNFIKEDYHYAMDYEYFLRLALKGYRFRHLGRLLADFRTHPDSKSQRQRVVQLAEMEKALLEQDAFLAGLNQPLRGAVRGVFMFMARAKRSWLKFISGAYRRSS